MASLADRVPRRALASGPDLLPLSVAGVAFCILYWMPAWTLARDWWVLPDAGHGLLLGPLSLYLAWKRGLAPAARPQPRLGLVLLAAAVLLRYVSGLAAEPFTMRLSLLGGAAALVVFLFGARQILHCWLSMSLLLLSVPIPAVILGSAALPLQLVASRLGAALLEWRHVPVLLAGNVIHLPGRSLFVTEACSGLRSLTALLALGILIGGLWLRAPLSRLLLTVAAIPIAVLLNGLRIFLTGFFVYFVDPRLGEGLMHYTEGWVLFVFAFGILGGIAWGLTALEAVAWRRAS